MKVKRENEGVSCQNRGQRGSNDSEEGEEEEDQVSFPYRPVLQYVKSDARLCPRKPYQRVIRVV